MSLAPCAMAGAGSMYRAEIWAIDADARAKRCTRCNAWRSRLGNDLIWPQVARSVEGCAPTVPRG